MSNALFLSKPQEQRTSRFLPRCDCSGAYTIRKIYITSCKWFPIPTTPRPWVTIIVPSNPCQSPFVHFVVLLQPS